MRGLLAALQLFSLLVLFRPFLLCLTTAVSLMQSHSECTDDGFWLWLWLLALASCSGSSRGLSAWGIIPSTQERPETLPEPSTAGISPAGHIDRKNKSLFVPSERQMAPFKGEQRAVYARCLDI